MKIIIAILIFSVLILFHELGHFLLAKRNGIIVEEFSLGMGPRIVSTVKDGTRYSWKAFPFGGSCMMKGEDEDEDGEGSFNSASVWGRISVIAAGPVFNFILAFFFALIVIGIVGYDPAEITAVKEGSPAAAAGLQEGDVLTRFKGERIDIGRDLLTYITLKGVNDDSITLEVLRDGEKKEIVYQPESIRKYMLGFSYTPDDEGEAVVQELTLNLPLQKAGMQVGDVITSIDGNTIESSAQLAEYMEAHPLSGEAITISYLRDGKAKEVNVTPVENTHVDIGFSYNLAREKTGALGVVKYGLVEMKYWVKTTVQSIVMLFSGQVSVNNMSGPVGVVDIIGDTYEQSKSEGALITWVTMLNMMIMLSTNLGIMNLLPLPALDGGRLLFLLIEAIRGKAVNRKAEGIIHFTGLVLLLGLIIYITFHDVVKLF